MNYELAKELKEAGFPFKHPQSKWSEYIFPTLSELIETCGDGFHLLQRKDIGGNWSAISRGGNSGEGKTPEESVARLWIATNKGKYGYDIKVGGNITPDQLFS